jgi:peptidoglycan hydrolase-like protein with peptidoglycan-binding domain
MPVQPVHAPGNTPSSPPKLSLGDKGPAVVRLQQQLARAGFSSGAADGLFGQGTKAAVVAFQRAKGLLADGVVGPATHGALAQAVGGPSPAPPPAPTPAPGPADTFTDGAPLLVLDKAQSYASFLQQAKAEGANPDHLAFLDRGLATSPYKANAAKAWELHARRPDGATLQNGGSAGFSLFPARGQRPAAFKPLPFVGPVITEAAVAVGSEVDGQMQARWYGKAPEQNAQFWSSTKSLNALGLISRLNAVRPDLQVEGLRIREAGSGSAGIPLKSLFQDITSYDAGVPRSNAGAGALGRMLGGPGREAFVEGNTGHGVEFNSNYGGGTLFHRPEVVTASGERVLLSPESAGTSVRNRVSAYDLTRVHAQAAWHGRLPEAARLPGAQSHSLGGWMQAMAEDPARYVDVGLKKLGLSTTAKNVAVSTKLGFGYAGGKFEAVYSGVVQFDDARFSPPRQRSMSFTLRGVHADAVQLDAHLAAETTELLRRLANGQL